MKKYFITGLVILLPLALTFAIVLFIFNLLTIPFLDGVKVFFGRYHLFESGFLFLSAGQFQNIVAQLLILLSLVLFIAVLGFLGHWFFFKAFMRAAEYIVKKIPLVSTIYKTCQEIIATIFTSQTNSFKQVVLVQFPNAQTYSLGLITNEEISMLHNTSYKNTVAVFVPTTPNPTSGFLMMFNKEDMIYLDMSVEDAFKYVISCGVISPTFQTTEASLFRNVS
jgi:uncharacterized membrane protein